MARLTLTFDNGPTPGITEEVLDTLDRFGVLATFFLVGSQLEDSRARDLADQAARAGHRIGNHTYNHGEPLGLTTTPGVASYQIQAAAAMLGPLAGGSPLFRPNGRGSVGPHLLNREAVDVLADMAATIVLWTSVPKDKKTVVPTPDTWLVQAKADALSREWSLMVLHDRPSGHSQSPMAYLGEFLAWTRASGIEIVQDLPIECLPMIRGIAQPSLSNYVTGSLD